jgi:hypothetical protein
LSKFWAARAGRNEASERFRKSEEATSPTELGNFLEKSSIKKQE